MSNLPPALLERLKRRGIIKVSSDENATKKPALDSTSSMISLVL